MRIGILTTFSAWAEGYSLVHIVSSQIRSIKKAGHTPILFVNENFHGDVPETCEVRPIVPVFTYEDYTHVTAIPPELVRTIKEAFEKNMTDIDVCFSHDLLLQDSFLAHNLALRMVNLPILWRHWIHSQPNNVKVGNLPENHKLVFLNYSDRLAVAERYQTWMENVSVVYNSVQPHVAVNDAITEQVSDIFEFKDVRIGYAFCSTRMGAKGVDKLLRLASRIKANGKTVGVCLMDSNANALREKDAIHNMMTMARGFGLDDEDFVFTSTLRPEFECGLPHYVVRDVLAKTNLFVFPSVSECCSLVLLEAMSGGNNLLVLNDDIPSMKEFGGYDSALYMKFGSIFLNTQYSDIGKYYDDWSKIILRQLGSRMPLLAKERVDTLFNEDYIWQKQMSKLL